MNLDKRKCATSKIHSDAWNGQVCDAICMTMVDGDQEIIVLNIVQ